jgi:hypothetical protein
MYFVKATVCFIAIIMLTIASSCLEHKEKKAAMPKKTDGSVAYIEEGETQTIEQLQYEIDTLKHVLEATETDLEAAGFNMMELEQFKNRRLERDNQIKNQSLKIQQLLDRVEQLLNSRHESETVLAFLQ